MIEGYYEDMDALNILRADHYPRCTEHVDGMVSIIEDLIERGHAYAADDGVYFDVSSAPEKYGQLTGQSFDAVRAGAGGRVDGTGGGKRDHRDLPLESGEAGRANVVFAMGRGPTRLAHRVHRDEPDASAEPSTSTVEATTCASHTTRPRSSKASAIRTMPRWCTTGCTTASSTWTARR